MSTSAGITIRYIYSACIVTSTADVRILHDPWFTDGIYDGSWYQFPKIDDPLKEIGDVDLIYISHIHPDHYDSRFIKKYFEKYGVKKLIISEHTPNHLAKKMRADGFSPVVVDSEMVIGRTRLQIVPHKTGSFFDIDSALVITYQDEQRRHCVVNANDIVFDQKMKMELKSAAGSIDILLCGYTGAGPYPQTYFDESSSNLVIEGEKKKTSFFERYRQLVKFMDAKVNIPFAGKYILGGRLTHLNKFRGIADPTEVLSFDSKAVVLAQGGEIDTNSFRGTVIRVEPYPDSAIENRENEIRSQPMAFERLISSEETHQLPIKRLLIKASENATKRSECYLDYFFCFQLPTKEYAVLNANKNCSKPFQILAPTSHLPEPRSEIVIDPRYLFGLLTGIYHWNNAEVGSQYSTRRFPNVYNLQAQVFLTYLTLDLTPEVPRVASPADQAVRPNKGPIPHYLFGMPAYGDYIDVGIQSIVSSIQNSDFLFWILEFGGIW